MVAVLSSLEDDASESISFKMSPIMDDGSFLSSCSCTVLVAVTTSTSNGRKEANRILLNQNNEQTCFGYDLVAEERQSLASPAPIVYILLSGHGGVRLERQCCDC